MDDTRIVKDELIGKHVKIIQSTDPTLTNVSGTIVDETKYTFLIETQQKLKRIAKNAAVFEFTEKGKKIIVKGSRLLYRPEDRIKKAR